MFFSFLEQKNDNKLKALMENKALTKKDEKDYVLF